MDRRYQAHIKINTNRPIPLTEEQQNYIIARLEWVIETYMQLHGYEFVAYDPELIDITRIEE